MIYTNGFDENWRNRVFQIRANGIDEVSLSQGWDGIRIRFELIGTAAEDFLNQAQGYAPVPSNLINHQDEALAAARRDAADAKRRAEAAESDARTMREEVSDYQGEIDALRDELEKEKNKVLIALDPASGAASSWARGGVIPGGSAPLLPGVSAHSRPLAIQQEILKHLSDQAWHFEYDRNAYSTWHTGTFAGEEKPEEAKIKFNLEQYEIDKYILDGETL